MFQIRPWPAGRLAALAAALALPAAAIPAPAAEPPADGAADVPARVSAPVAEAAWMRVSEVRDRAIDLEIAVRSYRRPEGGPRVDLVGVAHIADASYYRALQARLDAADLVLYEAVAPTGAVRPGGATPEARRESTRRAMGFLAALAAQAVGDLDAAELSTDALVAWIAQRDAKLADFAARAATDAWGRRLALVSSATAEGAVFELALRSDGADGLPGGEGEDRDLEVPVDLAGDRGGPAGLGSEDGLQAELARALDLSFQLDALDYDRDHFVPSDLSIDEVNDAIEARGGDFALFEDTLAGSSLPARVVRLLLGFLRTADRLLGGGVTMSVKVMLVEMLADEAAVEMGLEQMGEAFRGVIIDDRNARVIEDLERVLAGPEVPESIAIFYGAGHMPDFETRLGELGFVADGEAAWERAIRIDLEAAGVTSRELLPMRLMMKRSMLQMRREALPRD